MTKLRIAKLLSAFGILLCSSLSGVDYAFAHPQEYYSGTKSGGPSCANKLNRDGKWYCPTGYQPPDVITGYNPASDRFQVLGFKHLYGAGTVTMSTSTDDCNTHGSQGWKTLGGSSGVHYSISKALQLETNGNYSYTWVSLTEHRDCEARVSTGSCTAKAGEHKLLLMLSRQRTARVAQRKEYMEYYYSSIRAYDEWSSYAPGWYLKTGGDRYIFNVSAINVEFTPYSTDIACVDPKTYQNVKEGAVYYNIKDYRRLR